MVWMTPSRLRFAPLLAVCGVLLACAAPPPPRPTPPPAPVAAPRPAAPAPAPAPAPAVSYPVGPPPAVVVELPAAPYGPAVAARFPDPPVAYRTPAFEPGRTTFTSNAEMQSLMRGLVRDGRLVRLRVTMPDVSGSLAKVAAVIAEAGGNIVEIQHQRIFGTSSVRSPEVEFLVETRDRAHTDALVRALQEKSIRVSAS